MSPRKAKPKLDGCEFCLGAKGGVPGNEGLINGTVKICDHCDALLWPHRPKALVTINIGVENEPDPKEFVASVLISGHGEYENLTGHGETIPKALQELGVAFQLAYEVAEEGLKRQPEEPAQEPIPVEPVELQPCPVSPTGKHNFGLAGISCVHCHQKPDGFLALDADE